MRLIDAQHACCLPLAGWILFKKEKNLAAKFICCKLGSFTLPTAGPSILTFQSSPTLCMYNTFTAPHMGATFVRHSRKAIGARNCSFHTRSLNRYLHQLVFVAMVRIH